MLIENAIKHNVISQGKSLNIVIHSDERHLIIVNNLQRKKMVESSTGIGLENIRNRYSLLGMEDVGIEESSSHFTVRLPIIKP
jgi:LytS/YehU family sensor histidine kinase